MYNKAIIKSLDKYFERIEEEKKLEKEELPECIENEPLYHEVNE